MVVWASPARDSPAQVDLAEPFKKFSKTCSFPLSNLLSPLLLRGLPHELCCNSSVGHCKEVLKILIGFFLKHLTWNKWNNETTVPGVVWSMKRKDLESNLYEQKSPTKPAVLAMQPFLRAHQVFLWSCLTCRMGQFIVIWLWYMALVKWLEKLNKSAMLVIAKTQEFLILQILSWPEMWLMVF